MEITLTIPDEVAADLQNGSAAALSRRLLEILAIELYKADVFTSRQVRELLGFETREELWEFFKRNDVRDYHFTMEELEKERATVAALLVSE